MLIGLVYCVIQPIIAPLALIYFAIGVLIWKYQVVYVYVPLVESGGKVSSYTPLPAAFKYSMCSPCELCSRCHMLLLTLYMQ